MPLFSSSFKLGSDAPRSAFSSAPTTATGNTTGQGERFDITSSTEQLGTAVPATIKRVPSTRDQSDDGANASSPREPREAGRLQGLGLEHRPSNASDHPFHDDHEEELEEEGIESAAAKQGAVRRKGSSVSLVGLDLATVREDEEEPFATKNARPASPATCNPHTPPAIISISHPGSAFSSPFTPASASPAAPTSTPHSLRSSPFISPRSSSVDRMDRVSPPPSPGVGAGAGVTTGVVSAARDIGTGGGGGHGREHSGSSGGSSRNLRVSASPGRHHHGLSALSPLQGLSPMQPVSRLPGSHGRSVSSGNAADLREAYMSKDRDAQRDKDKQGGGAGAQSDKSDRGSLGGHSRTNSASGGSLSRSLSRRQSLYNAADSWREGREYRDENITNPQGLFSKLTLVKAPGEAKGLTNRQRSKSSSALAPMSLAPPGVTAPVDIPATSPRATRRSFASSFGAMSPITPARPVPSAPSTATDATSRISSYGDDAQTRGKNYTPDEVLDMARSLASPVLMSSGLHAPKGADLKRRKSAGASLGRSYGSYTNPGLSLSSSVSSTLSPFPEKQSAALEPVEYVQLDDETLLPYVDRASEVKELMAHPGNVKIFDMLRAAFPKEAARANWRDIPPTEWYWDELVLHLTTTDRIECPDYTWVLRARMAVRRRSVALWEKVGTCLGCDDRLLQAGSEDPDGAATWGGLGDEDDYEPFRGQVWIEGLSPVDPDEAERAERSFREEFGEIVEDDEAAMAGMTALLGTIGEGDEGSGHGSGHSSQEGVKRNTGLQSQAQSQIQTPAQRAGTRHQRDPLISPTSHTTALPGISSAGGGAHAGSPELVGSGKRSSRSKSFVGLTIHSGSLNSPPSFSRSHGLGLAGSAMGFGSMSMSRSPMFSPDAEIAMPTYDRGPGQALFPTGFASLSAEPNLGRAASGLVGGIKAQVVPSAFNYRPGEVEGARLIRRKSGTGLSESAITFVSESDWSGAGHHD